jgi:hypothetical protein
MRWDLIGKEPRESFLPGIKQCRGGWTTRSGFAVTCARGRFRTSVASLALPLGVISSLSIKHTVAAPLVVPH